ncbi:MAG: hypothetical protein AB9903_18115 [Vulcanimicrobiota bacterium]
MIARFGIGLRIDIKSTIPSVSADEQRDSVDYCRNNRFVDFLDEHRFLLEA